MRVLFCILLLIVISNRFYLQTINGWTNMNGASISIQNGMLAITKTGGGQMGVSKQASAPLGVGFTYEFTAIIDKGTCNASSGIEARIVDSGGQIIVSQQFFASGQQNLSTTFTVPVNGTYFMEFERIGSSSNCTFYINKIKLVQIETITEVCTVPVGEYRYGFNGMEKDDAIKGSGNSYDFGARMYDSRLGRWLSIDKEFSRYPEHTTYCFVANSPILLIDVDGNVIGNPNHPDAQKLKAELEKTDEGKLLWQAMVDSPREIFIYIVPTEGEKDVNQQIASDLINVDGQLSVSKAIGMVLPKKAFDEGKQFVEDTYTFDETTGNMTIAEDEPVVIIINEPGLIQQASIEYANEALTSGVEIDVNDEGEIQTPDYFTTVTWLSVGGEEAAHSLQNYYEPNLKWFDSENGVFIDLMDEEGNITLPQAYIDNPESDEFIIKTYPKDWDDDKYDTEKHTTHEIEAKQKAEELVNEYKSENTNPVTGE